MRDELSVELSCNVLGGWQAELPRKWSLREEVIARLLASYCCAWLIEVRVYYVLLLVRIKLLPGGVCFDCGQVICCWFCFRSDATFLRPPSSDLDKVLAVLTQINAVTTSYMRPLVCYAVWRFVARVGDTTCGDFDAWLTCHCGCGTVRA